MVTKKTPKPRIRYVDNLRIFLISLVVLHHLSITYGAPGSWFYNEAEGGFPQILPLSMFVTANQSFFMGMFFFISAYFIPFSLRRKGIPRFTTDRLLRLGIPTVFFFVLLFPLTVWIRNAGIYQEDVSLYEYIFVERIYGFGPMWFVEALLIFTLLYLLIFPLLKNGREADRPGLPGAHLILGMAILIGLIQYLIRIQLPVGWSMPFTEFQFPFFVQYVVLFSLGLVARKYRWLEAIREKVAWWWFGFAQVLILLVFPALFITGGALEGNIEAFVGRGTWQSFGYAVWEQVLGFSMIIGLFGIFKARLNRQGPLAKRLSASAYAVYVIHTSILVGMSFLFLDLPVHPFWKLVILAPIVLVVCFSLAYALKQIPFVRKIL